MDDTGQPPGEPGDRGKGLVSGGDGIAVLHGARVHVIGKGAFDIGRSPSCDLVIEHSSISRRHARIVQARAGHEVLDLDSRNGVWVDGQRVRGSAPVFPGVELRIGEVPLAVRNARRATGEQNTTRRDQPWSVEFGSPWDAGRPDGALPIVAGVLDALARGDLVQAEQIFARHLALPAERSARRGGLHEEVAATLADLALRLGEARASEVWLDFVVRLYSESDLVLPLPLVRSMDALAHKLGGIDRGALRQYTIRLAERARALTPEQRLALEQLTLLATERVSVAPSRRFAR
jgi:pSer/pThr/pTyr-binding forkhead associated (FHA) protein